MSLFTITGTSDAVENATANNGKDGAAFVRGSSTCREWIGTEGYPADGPGRYHLIVAFNCPW
jgi:glutathionyl-hydroquinone reductase